MRARVDIIDSVKYKPNVNDFASDENSDGDPLR